MCRAYFVDFIAYEATLQIAGVFGMQMPIKLLMPALAFGPRTGFHGQYITMRWFRVSRIGLAAY